MPGERVECGSKPGAGAAHGPAARGTEHLEDGRRQSVDLTQGLQGVSEVVGGQQGSAVLDSHLRTLNTCHSVVSVDQPGDTQVASSKDVVSALGLEACQLGGGGGVQGRGGREGRRMGAG